MKSQEVLTQLKTLLGMEVKLEEMELSNGTILEAESFESGQEVFIKTEDEKVALPEGIYDLADGRKLIVVEEGLIDEIKTESETQEETEMAENQETVLEEQDETQEMAYATKEELGEVKEMVEEIKAMIEAKDHQEEMSAEEVEEPTSEETELKEELSKPAVEAVKHSPEVETKRKQVLHSQSRPMTTLDKIMGKIANIN